MQILFELLKIPCWSSIYDLAPHDIKSVWSYTKKLIVIVDSEPNLDDGNWRKDAIQDAVERVAIMLWTQPRGSQRIIREYYEGKIKA